MDTFKHNIIADIFLFGIAAIVIALPIYYFIRQKNPQLGWNTEGNVPTSHFNRNDILGITLILSYFGASSIFLYLLIDTSSVKEVNIADRSAFELVLSTLIYQAIPIGLIALLLATRTNLLDAFGLRHPNTKKVLLSSLIGIVAIWVIASIAVFILTPFLEARLGEKENQAAVQMILDAKEKNPQLLLALAFGACIVAPICEEIVFRGYLYGVLKKYSCTYFATITSAVLFSIIHNSLWSFIPLAIIGVVLAIIYEVTGSLWTSILTHAVFNTVNVTLLITMPNV